MKVADGFEPGEVIEGGRESRGAHRRRGQEGRQGGYRRQAVGTRRHGLSLDNVAELIERAEGPLYR
jgi:hypothetical protein